eukprot:4832390-Pyramimonas_sp.AAC.2
MRGTNSTALELNAKFQGECSFSLEFGSLDRFYGGLTGLVGPVRKLGGSIEKAMGHEHCNEQDSMGEFTSSNGMSTWSNLEWELVEKPIDGKRCPDRFELGGSRCHCPCTREELVAKMKDKSKTRSDNNHSELIVEEAMAATLYTGPMYEKCNLVLRAKTGKPFLKERFDKICKGIG